MSNALDSITLMLPDDKGEIHEREFNVLEIERLMEQHSIDIKGVFSGTYPGFPLIDDKQLLDKATIQLASSQALRNHTSSLRRDDLIRLSKMKW